MGSSGARIVAALAGALAGAVILGAIYVISLAPAASPTPFAQLTTPPPTATASPSPPPAVTPTPDPDATPTPTPLDILPFLTSEITVVNLAEQQLALTVTLLDPESSDEFALGTYEVEPLQVTTQSIVPTRFRLEFAFTGGGSAGTCTIDVGDGEQIHFAVIETGVALVSSTGEPADPAELVVATSSRCQAGGET
ncbi:MAG TPA: hypothetical protein VNT28_04455 [Candidatus Limnocylindrales bacterium]|nr:hypothetical protein [Candidatus Limnocylindrales bacterium]